MMLFGTSFLQDALYRRTAPFQDFAHGSYGAPCLVEPAVERLRGCAGGHDSALLAFVHGAQEPFGTCFSSHSLVSKVLHFRYSFSMQPVMSCDSRMAQKLGPHMVQ